MSRCLGFGGAARNGTRGGRCPCAHLNPPAGALAISSNAWAVSDGTSLTGGRCTVDSPGGLLLSFHLRSGRSAAPALQHRSSTTHRRYGCCNAVLRAASQCSMLQHSGMVAARQHGAPRCNAAHRIATPHTVATPHTALQHSMLRHSAPRCDAAQHVALSTAPRRPALPPEVRSGPGQAIGGPHPSGSPAGRLPPCGCRPSA